MKKLMNVFISQPMRGRSDEDILKERNEAMRTVQMAFVGADAHEIKSFFEDYNPEKGCIPLKYLAKSLDLLADADVAFFCKGWEDARGCRIEHEAAKEYDIPIMEAV